MQVNVAEKRVMNADARIAIAWTFDEHYIEAAATSISSTLRHLPLGINAIVAIVANNISFSGSSRFKDWFAKRHPDHVMRWIDAPTIDVSVKRGHVTESAYLRLLLPDLLPDLDRVLYIDPDTVILDDLTQLFETNLFNSCMGAVQDRLIPSVSSENGLKNWKERGLDKNAPYFNSGVLLFNLNLIRRCGGSLGLLSMAKKMESESRFWDQDVLNVYFSEKWLLLPPRYNFPHLMIKGNGYGNVSILHFVGPLKPWRHGPGVPCFFRYHLELRRSNWYSPVAFVTIAIRRCMNPITRRLNWSRSKV